MAPLKPILLTCGFASALTSSCPADSGDDQSAFLQNHVNLKSDLSLVQHSAAAAHLATFPKLSSLNDPDTRKAALIEFQKTAVKLASLDRAEATPEVVQVCEMTANLLNNTVLYAIIEEDAADRASLQTAYDAFEPLEAERQAAEDAILAAEAIVSQRANALVICRNVEIETCVDDTVCVEVIDEDCTKRDQCEIELEVIDSEIHNSWCEDGAVRTSTEFRQTTVEVMYQYGQKVEECAELNRNCELMEDNCTTTREVYIERATQCSVKQAELQMASCEYQHVAAGALAAYQEGFLEALAYYNDVVASVMIKEADRKVEWDVLTRVICLLLTLTQQATEEGDLEHGLVSSDETAARIETCWTEEVDISHLDIDYLDPPVMLSIPELPPFPCTVDYNDRYNLGPPAACAMQVEMHITEANTECSCLADPISEQGLILGHYLLIDPAVPMTVAGGEWSIQLDGVTYAGALSLIHSEDFSVLSAEMLSSAELDENDEDYTGPITQIAWAYPSTVAHFQGPMSLGQRFASQGGLVFMNAGGQVIDIRELATSSGRLGQPVSALLSFSSAEEITDEQAAEACPTMHPVAEMTRHYAQGARDYCWVMGSTILPQCYNGCFVYNMVYGKVVFPLIEGLHIMSADL